MTWFRVDDGAPDHPKMLKAGRDARALWYVAGPKCASVDSDGLVDPDLLAYFGGLAEVDYRPAVRRLVRVGLWHDSRSLEDCGRCAATLGTELRRGWFYFHDWCDYQVSNAGKRDPIERKRDRRKRQLHRTEKGLEVKGHVRERDLDLCRYCGELTHWTTDHRSPLAGTIDHVDPLDFTSAGTGNSPANCVVACRRCNGRKRDRTPEQAGLELLPVPSR